MDMGTGTTPYSEFVDRPDAERQRRHTVRHACWRALCSCCFTPEPRGRLIRFNAGRPTERRYARNVTKNTKYSPLTFVPKLLFEQFRYFFNLYYLLVALSQFFPPLQIGLLFTYIAPLIFVLTVTMAKEAYDDVQRWRTDVAINQETYERLLPTGETEPVKAQDILVGHLIRVSTDQRVPADLVMLRTHDASGTAFVRTDQARARPTHRRPHHPSRSPPLGCECLRFGSARWRDRLEASPRRAVVSEAAVRRRARRRRAHSACRPNHA